jgi:nicotinamide riboside kinase
MSYILYDIKNIPESSGKTTLCKKIAENLKNIWVPEPCRLAAEEKPINPEKIDFQFNLDDFKKMAYHLSKTKQKIPYL